jgi:RNA polymerase sigma factor (sigma-70 family)
MSRAVGGTRLRGRPPVRGDAGGAAASRVDPDAADMPPDFEDVYTRYRTRVYVLCLGRLGERELAEDVVQEVFAKVLLALPQSDRSRPVWPWLASIAHRECIDAHRRRVLTRSRHTDLVAASPSVASDATARTALGRVAHDSVAQEVTRLPTRQRAALLLFAVDGWSYADIADRLGCSVGSVKLLIVRARARLRRARDEVLGGLGAVLRQLVLRVEGTVGRLGLWRWRATAGLGGPSAVEGSVGVALVVAAALLGLGLPAPSTAAASPGVDAGATTTASSPAPTLGGASVTDPRVPVEPAVQARSRTLQRSAHEAAAALSPEPATSSDDGHVLSVTVSPGYATEPTVYAVENERGAHAAGNGGNLLVSRDGGASWARLRALGMTGARVMLPPAYPRDDRIFSLGAGLQMSDNGGDTFETVAPGDYVDAAMSPGFDAGDPVVVLVARAGTLVRYDSRRELVEPLLLDERLAGHLVTGVAYGLADSGHRTVRVLSRLPVSVPRETDDTRTYLATSHLSECVLPAARPDDVVLHAGPPARLVCTRSQELDRFYSVEAGLRASPVADTSTVVRGVVGLLVSTDGGRRFRSAAGWGGPFLLHLDVAAVPGLPSSLVLARPAQAGEPALLRTDDAGASWTPLFVDVPGFERGAQTVAVTPTGRILAARVDGDLACSVDGGRTWAPLCPTPDA